MTIRLERKTMKKRTETEVKALKEQAEQIRFKYDYLDNLPSCGWIWEFVRRSEHYRNSFQTLKESIAQGIAEDTLERYFMDFKRKVWGDGILIPHGTVRTINKEMLGGYLEVRLPNNRPKDNAFMNAFVHNQDAYRCGCIPDPNKKFIDFKIVAFLAELIPRPRTINFETEGMPDIEYWDNLPQRAGAKPLFTVHKTIKDVIIGKIIKDENCSINEPLSAKDKLKVERYALDDEPDKDTFYVAISRWATNSDLKKHLLAKIKNYLIPDKPRMHDSKWKFYLIVFDLQEKSGDENIYDFISNLLIEAYHRSEIMTKKGKPTKLTVPFDVENIENYHKNACSLIAGGYKKYLL
jgi:hypothetical protein